MENEVIISLLKGISWAGVAGLFIYFILRPCINFWLGKFNNKLNNTKNGMNLQIKGLDEKVNNHVQHDVEKLQDEDKKLWAAVSNMQGDIKVIKDRLKI